MSQLTHSSLSSQQAAFVQLLARKGYNTDEAAKRAGYHPEYGYQLIRNPAVVGAIHEILQTELTAVLAPSAFKVARKLMEDDQVSARVRADIAFKFMDRAGHITPSNKGSAAPKALSEMTRDEMLEFINVNQAAIDKMEAELAERATDVSAPQTPKSLAPIDAKPLNYLD